MKYCYKFNLFLLIFFYLYKITVLYKIIYMALYKKKYLKYKEKYLSLKNQLGGDFTIDFDEIINTHPQ